MQQKKLQKAFDLKNYNLYRAQTLQASVITYSE